MFAPSALRSEKLRGVEVLWGHRLDLKVGRILVLGRGRFSLASVVTGGGYSFLHTLAALDAREARGYFYCCLWGLGEIGGRDLGAFREEIQL